MSTDARAIPSAYAGLGEPRDMPASLADVQILAGGLVALADEVTSLTRGMILLGDALQVDCAALEARNPAALSSVRARLLALEGASEGVEKILRSIRENKTAALTGQAVEAALAGGPRPSTEDVAYYEALEQQGSHGMRR